jgi:hypothetical protein
VITYDFTNPAAALKTGAGHRETHVGSMLGRWAGLSPFIGTFQAACY